MSMRAPIDYFSSDDLPLAWTCAVTSLVAHMPTRAMAIVGDAKSIDARVDMAPGVG
jgi:hypothetical protein